MLYIITIFLSIISVYLLSKELMQYKNISKSYHLLIYLISIGLLPLAFLIIKSNLIYFIIPIIPLLIAHIIIDLKEQDLPNLYNLQIAICGFMYIITNVIIGEMTLKVAGMCLLTALIMSVMYLLLALFTNQLGMGDVKLIGAISLFFPFTTSVLIKLIILPIYLGGIASLLILLHYFLFNRKNENVSRPKNISFGPYIIITFILLIINGG